MERSYGMTSHHIGTLLNRLLADPSDTAAKFLNIQVLLAMPINEEASDDWKASCSEDELITPDAAADAITRAHEWTAAKSKRAERPKEELDQEAEEKLVESVDSYMAEHHRLETEVRELRVKYCKSIEAFLGHAPTTDEIEDIERTHGDRKARVTVRRNERTEARLQAMRQEILAKRAAESPEDRFWREAASASASRNASADREREARDFAQMAKIIHDHDHGRRS